MNWEEKHVKEAIEIIKRNPDMEKRRKMAVQILLFLAETKNDEETDHVLADQILLAIINDPAVTDAFGSIKKWYG